MRKNKICYIVFLIAFVLLNIYLINKTIHNQIIKDTYFRIHIVANSDSIDDQLLKYTVAKEINEYVQTITINANSKKESKDIITENVNNILTKCNEVLSKNDSNYPVKALIGNIKYDEKVSDNFYMEQGVYDSLKIVIGNGNGSNWWSLIYPNSISKLADDENINEDYECDNSYSTEVEFEFGIINILKKVLHAFSV